MSQILTISDRLYTRLEHTARERGFTSIEQLLGAWQAFDAERQQRQRIVQHIDHLRDGLLAKYGQLPDSVELLREDCAR